MHKTAIVDKEASLDPLIDERALPTTDTQQQAYEKVLAQAKALNDDDLKRLSVESRLAYVNALDGHAKVELHLARARKLPEADVDAITKIPTFAAALLYAERLLSIIVPKKSDHPKRMLRARQLRHLFLLQAEAAAVLDLVPEEAVQRIRAGRGSIDMVEDVIALVALYRRHEADLAGRTLATPELLDEAERLAATLQAELRPVAAKPKARAIDEELAQASDMRNRMWTLLVSAHAELQRVANYLGIEGVPSLQSRKGLKKKQPLAAESTEPISE